MFLVEQLSMALEDEREEIKVIRKKNANNIRDLQRQLQQSKRYRMRVMYSSVQLLIFVGGLRMTVDHEWSFTTIVSVYVMTTFKQSDDISWGETQSQMTVLISVQAIYSPSTNLQTFIKHLHV